MAIVERRLKRLESLHGPTFRRAEEEENRLHLENKRIEEARKEWADSPESRNGPLEMPSAGFEWACIGLSKEDRGGFGDLHVAKLGIQFGRH